MCSMAAESNGGLLCERKKETLYVTLSRPEKSNALTPGIVQALTSIVQQAAEDSAVFRLVLASEGKYFCAGVDLGADGGILAADAEAKQRQWHMIQDLFRSIQQSPKVTIAVVSGPAYGAGVGLAFACDIRIAATNASFHIGEAKLGMMPAVVMHLIVQEWGLGLAREAMLTGRSVRASELEPLKVVHAVVEDAAGLSTAVDRYIGYLDACGPEALAAIKKALLVPMLERPAIIKGMYDMMMEPTKEVRHGIASFHAKKKPEWARYYCKTSANL